MTRIIKRVAEDSGKAFMMTARQTPPSIGRNGVSGQLVDRYERALYQTG